MLALVLVLVMGGVESRTSVVDGPATRAALRIRVGERASAWTITVEPGSTAKQVRVHMRHDAGRELEQSFALQGQSTEERSRELAAALALVIEQHATDTSPTSPKRHDRVAPAAAPEGWLAVGGRVAVGHPPDPDGGVTLRGGVLWGRRIVQPIGSFATAHARRDTLRVDGVRFGAGVAIGSPIPGSPVWLGGAVLPQAAWTVARGRGRAGGWSSVTELAALAQLRVRPLLVGLRVGVELAAPPLKLEDRGAALRFGAARLVIGLEVGVLLPPRRNAR